MPPYKCTKNRQTYITVVFSTFIVPLSEIYLYYITYLLSVYYKSDNLQKRKFLVGKRKFLVGKRKFLVGFSDFLEVFNGSSSFYYFLFCIFAYRKIKDIELWHTTSIRLRTSEA